MEKSKNALTKESEYGVLGIRLPLQEVAIKAEEVWGPALGGREKEEALKAVQAALDQYREVFTLSGVVSEAIKKNDYDNVVDAYKKAKSHADKARKIAAIAKENNMQLGDADVQQIIVTARMWHDVNSQVDTFKQEVWRRLRNSHGRKPAAVGDETDKELHMELLATLLQLGVEENPIWVWINSHYLYLRERIARTFERSRIEIEIMRRRLAGNTRVDGMAFAKHLRSAAAAAGTLRFSGETGRDLDTPAILAFWEKIQSSLSALLSPKNGILADVVEWHTTAQDFVENKAQKAFPTGVFASGFTHLSLEPEHVDGIRKATIDLVTILRESVASFFQDAPVDDLSDLYSPIPPTPITPDSKTPTTPGAMRRGFTFDLSNAPPLSPRKGDAWEKFAFWAPNSNSLSGAHYLARLITLVGSGMGELASLDVVNQSHEPEKLKTLITNVRERLITAICSSWSADSEKCRLLESWTRSPERRDLTLMPAFFEAWEEKVMTNVQKIAYIDDAATSKSGAGAVEIIVPPSAKLLQVVRGCFTTSLYKSLNGMVENAESLKGDTNAAGEEIDPDGVTIAKKRQLEAEDLYGTEPVDASNKVCRLMQIHFEDHTNISTRTSACS
jgi:exocyst complex component 2